MSHHSEPRRGRLLVVDDEEGLLFLLQEALAREGYEVEGCTSGESALEWLRNHSPDLLLLDLKLGDLPASALVERLRQQGRDIPFLIITGHGDERTVVELMKQGALDYVMKDKALIELLPSVVRRALAIVDRDHRLREANDALRRREERHRKIILTALDGFACMNPSGRFLEVNEALCQLLGYSLEELMEMGASDVEEPGSGHDLSHWLRLSHPERARFSTQFRRADGTRLEVEISLQREGTEIFGFVRDITQQRRLEREVLEISEDERRRFGRDLHDGLGQQLTALELMSHSLARDLENIDPAHAAAAQEIATHTRAAVVQTRRLAHSLAPVALEEEGLMTALNDLAHLTSRAKIACTFECETLVAPRDPAVATHLFRVAQEAVNNSMKHARAKRITIALHETAERIELVVADDGRGFESGRKAAGLGLQVMEYRARLIGGRLEIASPPGKGVKITCSVPRNR